MFRLNNMMRTRDFGFGYGYAVPVPPDWWMIDTLSEDDILGVWDFAWGGHKSRDDAFVPFSGTMPNLTVDSGDPGWNKTTGVYFGGQGVIKSDLPEVEVHNLSVIIQFSNAVQNGTLDAFFSHYLDSSHYTLQNKFSDNTVRWSCGDGDSPTLEVAGEMLTEGVYGVSGPHLYINGALIGTQPDEGVVTVSGLIFRLGAIFSGSGNTQFIKANVQKLLIVNRRLTDREQNEISVNISGSCDKPDGELLDNWTFDCGIYKWGHDENYPAIVTDNRNGSLHLKSESDFGSLVPELDGVLPSDTYILECKVANISGIGKMSIRESNNTWHNGPDITTDGVHQFEYTGDVKEIHCGANSDPSYEADYEYISLRKSTSTIQTPDLDGDGNPDTLLFQQGNITVTEDADSINIDYNGDQNADIIIPK